MQDHTRSKNDCNSSRNNHAKLPKAAYERITVLGIGNVLWADEGFGVRAIETLQQRYEFMPQIQLQDGGTQGLLLIETVMEANALIILDAVDYGLKPGTLHRVEGADVPKFLGAKKMSLHQTGFQEVLQLADLMGSYPEQVVLIGCQPQELEDYGGSLRPVVKAALEQAIDETLACLSNWGVQAKPRVQDLNENETLVASSLSMEAYEMGRPSAEVAFRLGDERFLVGTAAAESTAVVKSAARTDKKLGGAACEGI